MFQFLAITQAGCRRSFPRHLLHRITTLAISTVVVLVAQVIYTQPVNADQASRPNIVLIMADVYGKRPDFVCPMMFFRMQLAIGGCFTCQLNSHCQWTPLRLSMTQLDLRCDTLKHIIDPPTISYIHSRSVPPQDVQRLEIWLQGTIVVDRDQEATFRPRFAYMPSLDVSGKGDKRFLGQDLSEMDVTKGPVVVIFRL